MNQNHTMFRRMLAGMIAAASSAFAINRGILEVIERHNKRRRFQGLVTSHEWFPGARYNTDRFRDKQARQAAAAAKRERRRERNLRLAYCGAIQFVREGAA